MRVRKKINGLRQFGRGQQSLWVNSVDGVGQCITTRLMLWAGQWYLDLPAGTKYLTKILGKYTGNTADAEVRSRVLGTTGVTEILNYSSSLNRTNRRWSVNMTVNTLYGPITISGYLPPPGPTPPPGPGGIGFFVVGGSGIGTVGLG